MMNYYVIETTTRNYLLKTEKTIKTRSQTEKLFKECGYSIAEKDFKKAKKISWGKYVTGLLFQQDYRKGA